MAKEVSRRDFLKKSVMGSIAAGVALYGVDRIAMRPKSASAAGLALNSHEYETVAAIADRIIPTECEHYGARETDVVVFIDNSLADKYDYKESSRLSAYQAGVANVDAVCNSAYGKTFVKLNGTQQDAILRGCDDSVYGASLKSFFEVVLMHSWEGFLSHPKYGGNKNYNGWYAIGYPIGGGLGEMDAHHMHDVGDYNDVNGGCHQCHDFGNPNTGGENNQWLVEGVEHEH